MTLYMTRLASVLFAAAVSLAAQSLGAQAWNYPSFHHPHIMLREYNFGVADGGDAGTSLIVQWREGMSPSTEFSLEAGLVDPDFGDTRFLFGGGLGYRLAQARAEMPFDMILTAGVYGSIGGSISVFRLPVGLSIGHRFPLEGSLAITPYVHPRVSLDLCDDCADGSEVSINFDLGADFELTRQLSLRFAALFSGSDITFLDDTGFGISVAWKPHALTPR